MKPSLKKMLISVVVVAGLFSTYGCGGDKTNASEYSLDTGKRGGVTISNDVGSPSEMGVGDIMMVQFSSLENATLDFSGVDESSGYYLVVGSLDYGTGLRHIQIDSDVSSVDAKNAAEASYEESEWKQWTYEDAFYQRLHDVELAMSLDPEFEVASAGGGLDEKAIVDAAVSVGDTEEFRVLNSLSTLSSYSTVTARARCVADNVIVYVDTEVERKNPTDVTDTDVADLCEEFNNQVATERQWFGEESDVNGDGRIAALITPQVNRLGAMGGGIITGFFLASDLFNRSGGNAISNQREIVHIMTADSRGDYGTVIPRAFAWSNLMYAVLPHEVQHVISYNRHVFEGEGTPEQNWLNEGLSHLVEDLLGRGHENYSRSAIFLSNPSYYPLAASGSPDLGERGASYLFMRYLYEQHADPTGFLWALFHNNLNGVGNIEEAFAGTEEDFDQFGEFFMRWMVALAMTDRGISEDSRYVYRERVRNAGTGNYQGTCMLCDAEDNRGTLMTGPSMETYSGGDMVSLYPSTMKFYEIQTPPATIAFDGISSGSFGAALVRAE